MALVCSRVPDGHQGRFCLFDAMYILPQERVDHRCLCSIKKRAAWRMQQENDNDSISDMADMFFRTPRRTLFGRLSIWDGMKAVSKIGLRSREH